MKIKPLGFWASLVYPLLILLARGDRRTLLIRRMAARRKRAQDRREWRRMDRLLRIEGRQYAETIQDHLARMGAARVPRSGDPLYEKISRRKRAKTQYVRFQKIDTSPEVIWLQVLVTRRTLRGNRSMLPQFVDVDFITNEYACAELSHACLRAVTSKRDEFNKGVYFLVHRLESESGLPRLVKFRDMLSEWPDDMSEAPIVLGIEAHRRVRIVNLDDHPHVLIGGSSGSGKSNFLNAILSGLIRYSNPSQLQMVMIDLKQLELVLYDDAPHLREPVVEDAVRAVEIFEEMFKEMKRRMAKMSRKAKKISEWNAMHPDDQLPRLIVIVDEYTELINAADDISKRKRLEQLIIRIASLGRAVGLHMILCTQRPAASLISNDVKANMPLIIAGRVQNTDQSRVIVGTGAAADLPLHPGRMMFQSGLTTGIIQAPLITKQDIDECILMARGKAAGLITLDHTQADINPAGLVRWAIDQGGKILDGQAVWDLLKPYGITHQQVKAFYYELWKARTVVQDKATYGLERVKNGLKLVLISGEEQAAPAPVVEAAQDTGVPSFDLKWIPVGQRAQPPLLLPAPVPVEPIPAPVLDLAIEDQWLRDCCDIAPNGRETAARLYESYRFYCEERDYVVKAKNAFGMWLKTSFTSEEVGHDKIRVWCGLTLKASEPALETAYAAR